MRARARRKAGAGCAVGMALLLTGAVGLPTPAGAAGAAPAAPVIPVAPTTCPESILDRYEPGDEVTVVGYTAGCLGIGADAHAEAVALPSAVSGYLHTDPCTIVDLDYCAPLNGPTDPASGTPMGQVALTTPADAAWGQRMELTFRLPAGMATGLYYLVVCEDPCVPRAPGQMATTPLYVGVDPPADGRPVRHWPLDEPAIAALPDDALVQPGDGRTLTGAEARGGGAADPTVVAGGLDAAADDGAGGDRWPPPGGALAATLVVVLAVVAVAGWRRGTTRKQVRHAAPPERHQAPRSPSEPAQRSLTSSALQHVPSAHGCHTTDHVRRVRPPGLEDRARRHRRGRGQVVEGRRDR